MKRLLAALLLCLPLAADTDPYTWDDSTDWNTPWTAIATSGACDTTNTFDYSTSNCNSNSACRYRHCVGRNDNGVIMTIRWSGSWEDLGVTPGNTVSTVQMTDLNTKMLVWNVCSSTTLGPLELRDSSDVTQATLWIGRSPTAQEGSFTAEGSQSAQSVGTLTASNASIRFNLQVTTSTGNNGSAECSSIFDDLDISIESTAPSGAAKRTIVITRARFGWRDGEFRLVSSEAE